MEESCISRLAEHLYTTCARVLPFMRKIENLLYTLCNRQITCSWQNVIMGVDNDSANLVLTLAAFTIFKTWVAAEKSPTQLQNTNVWNVFLSEVKHRREIQQIIVWQQILNFITHRLLIERSDWLRGSQCGAAFAAAPAHCSKGVYEN